MASVADTADLSAAAAALRGLKLRPGIVSSCVFSDFLENKECNSATMMEGRMLSVVVDWLQARFGENSVEICVQPVFVAGLEPGCQDVQTEMLQFACSGPGLRLMESNHRASV